MLPGRTADRPCKVNCPRRVVTSSSVNSPGQLKTNDVPSKVVNSDPEMIAAQKAEQRQKQNEQSTSWYENKSRKGATSAWLYFLVWMQRTESFMLVWRFFKTNHRRWDDVFSFWRDFCSKFVGICAVETLMKNHFLGQEPIKRKVHHSWPERKRKKMIGVFC